MGYVAGRPLAAKPAAVASHKAPIRRAGTKPGSHTFNGGIAMRKIFTLLLLAVMSPLAQADSIASGSFSGTTAAVIGMALDSNFNYSRYCFVTSAGNINYYEYRCVKNVLSFQR